MLTARGWGRDENRMPARKLSEGPNVNLNVRVRRDLWRRVKVRSFGEQRFARDFIIEALREHLARRGPR